ncbi:PR domain Zinc finger protein 16-like isoform x4 [Plakobranchus ocellatus]|uniref:PR domain Zinc finger protein 16-like isoform x4 n=1 Tax=Plakobranchus ocellatus TaxID=259542 RepID=A0AAV4ARS5_9GAST|nr:PR domain Zinc finger protein 16-like isoform x4 [Plakobranchus ocellatus]
MYMYITCTANFVRSSKCRLNQWPLVLAPPTVNRYLTLLSVTPPTRFTESPLCARDDKEDIFIVGVGEGGGAGDRAGVFYKSVRDIAPGEEMLLYAREAVYPELELEALARHNSLTGERPS